MKKKLYIAAPFFTPDQVTLVQAVESAIINTPGLDYYSPRFAAHYPSQQDTRRMKAGL